MRRILNPFAGFIKKSADFLRRLPQVTLSIKKIRTKLILVFLIPISLIAVQGIMTYSNSSRMVRANMTETSLSTMENSGKYLEVILGTVESLAGQIFSDTDIQNYLSGRYREADVVAQADTLKNARQTLINIAHFSNDIKIS